MYVCMVIVIVIVIVIVLYCTVLYCIVFYCIVLCETFAFTPYSLLHVETYVFQQVSQSIT